MTMEPMAQSAATMNTFCAELHCSPSGMLYFGFKVLMFYCLPAQQQEIALKKLSMNKPLLPSVVVTAAEGKFDILIQEQKCRFNRGNFYLKRLHLSNAPQWFGLGGGKDGNFPGPC